MKMKRERGEKSEVEREGERERRGEMEGGGKGRWESNDKSEGSRER